MKVDRTVPATPIDGRWHERLHHAVDPNGRSLNTQGPVRQNRGLGQSLHHPEQSIDAPNRARPPRFLVRLEYLMEPAPDLHSVPVGISQALVQRAQAGDRGATDELFSSLYNELH